MCSERIENDYLLRFVGFPPIILVVTDAVLGRAIPVTEVVFVVPANPVAQIVQGPLDVEALNGRVFHFQRDDECAVKEDKLGELTQP